MIIGRHKERLLEGGKLAQTNALTMLLCAFFRALIMHGMIHPLRHILL